MKNFGASVGLLFILAVSGLKPNDCRGQAGSFNELFRAAFQCADCADTTQIALYTKAIDHGISDDDDLYNFHNALVNRGRLYSDVRDFDRAVKDFSLAIDVMPDDHAILSDLATALLENGQYKAALEGYDEYIATMEAQKAEASEFFAANPNVAKDSEENRDLEGMRRSAIEEVNEKLARAYNNRGICKGHLRNHQGACADFRKAYEAGMHNLKSFIDAECQ